MARHLTNVSHLIVCPDGQLGRVPFEMLPLPPFGPQLRYLVEEKTISYVTSGREIARLGRRVAHRNTNAPVVMGNPDFDLVLGSARGSRAVAGGSPATSNTTSFVQRTATVSEEANVSGGPPDTAREPRALPVARSLSRSYRGIQFAPLPGSEAEARSVAKLLGGDCVLRVGKEARETELRKVVSPRVLHLATHGFFLKDQEFNRTN